MVGPQLSKMLLAEVAIPRAVEGDFTDSTGLHGMIYRVESGVEPLGLECSDDFSSRHLVPLQLDQPNGENIIIS